MKKKLLRLLAAFGVAAAVTAVPIAVAMTDAGPTNTSATIKQATEAVMIVATPATAAAVMTADAVVQTDIGQATINYLESFAPVALLALALGTGFVLLAMQRGRRFQFINTGDSASYMKHAVFANDTGTKGWTDDDSAMMAWAKGQFRQAKDTVLGSGTKALAGVT